MTLTMPNDDEIFIPTDDPGLYLQKSGRIKRAISVSAPTPERFRSDTDEKGNWL